MKNELPRSSHASMRSLVPDHDPIRYAEWVVEDFEKSKFYHAKTLPNATRSWPSDLADSCARVRSGSPTMAEKQTVAEFADWRLAVLEGEQLNIRRFETTAWAWRVLDARNPGQWDSLFIAWFDRIWKVRFTAAPTPEGAREVAARKCTNFDVMSREMRGY